MRIPSAAIVLIVLLAGCAEGPVASEPSSADASPARTPPLPTEAPSSAVLDGRPLGLLPIARAAMLAEHPDAKLAFVRCADDIWACQDTFGPLDGTGSEWVFGFLTDDGREFEVAVARNGTIGEDGIEEDEPSVNADDFPPMRPLPDDPRIFDTERIAKSLFDSDERVRQIEEHGLGSWWYVLGEEGGRAYWTVGWLDVESDNDMGIEIRTFDALTGEIAEPMDAPW